MWSARPRRCSSPAAPRPPGRSARPAASRARSGARPRARARRAASRRRGWRSRASCGSTTSGGSSRAMARRWRRFGWRGPDPAARGDALHEAHQLEVEERHAQLEAARPSTSCRCRAGSRPAGTCACRGRAPARAGRGPARPRGCRARWRGARARPLRARRAAHERSAGLRVGDLHQPQQRAARRPGRRARARGGARAAARGSARASAAAGAAAAVGHEPQRPQQRGGLVAPVAPVRLVGALSRQHHLHVLARRTSRAEEGGRARDAARLLEPRHRRARAR